MDAELSPFLIGALGWLYGAEQPESCPGCRYAWGSDPEVALAAIAAAPERYAALLEGRDGMVPADDGGWNATAYVWHLVDLARSWTERWVQLASAPGSLLAGWDPDVLAAARNYRALPTDAALWALRDAAGSFVARSHDLPAETPFEHGDWGSGTVGDGIRWLGHEFVHHQLDVAARAW